MECSLCNTKYARKWNLKRHMETVHSKENEENQEENSEQRKVVFIHPFTMMIVGMTGTGKTTLLPKVIDRIDTEPGTMIYMYRHWQPMYSKMRKMYPKMRFVQGIPRDFDVDKFDKNTCNIIIIDDLMSTACKDGRITSLFTDGSHHCNISVISLSQNMFYGKDPTQRRNCQYLILFNNPVDMQAIMIFARQMNPQNPSQVWNEYKAAVEKPFGYIVIDCKATTPNAHRLNPNCLNETDSKEKTHEKEQKMDTEKELQYLKNLGILACVKPHIICVTADMSPQRKKEIVTEALCKEYAKWLATLDDAEHESVVLNKLRDDYNEKYSGNEQKAAEDAIGQNKELISDLGESLASKLVYEDDNDVKYTVA